MFSTNAISCTLDATTGEFIAVDYTLGSEEIAAMQATAVPACFIQRQTPTLRAAMAIGMKPKRAMPGQWRS